MTDIQARIPRATYRLQFNSGFTFRDAAGILPYLHDLGVSDIYSSPYFRAKPGSLHGYDITDHGSLNPDIGGEEDYAAMEAGLRGLGMGQILDIVPNHMCIESSENRWWMDVLENGPSSPYAGYFDIDWSPVKKELMNRVLIPVLGGQYGNVLESQEIKLVFDEGSFTVCYHDHRFPVRPQTYATILEHRLTELQDALTAESPDLGELLSIITALRNLPSYLEQDHTRIEERYREKEIAKRRLEALCNRCAEVRAHVEENVRLFNGIKGDPASFDLLDGLMDEQIYRLSDWRVAMEEINYRRFFDINSLGAIRMENPEVFRAAHELVFRLVREGSVTGLRVDHPDGLYNPVEYFNLLQRNCYIQLALAAEGKDASVEAEHEAVLGRQYDETVAEDPHYKPFYIVGEKILIRSERMPEDWSLFSTTGYVFLNSVNGIFIDGGNARVFDALYEKFTGRRAAFADVVYDKKKLVMQVAMASEVNTVGHYLNDISERNRHTRDFTLNSLTAAIIEVIACFPVYRTYIHSPEVSDRDRQYIEHAVSRAQRKNPVISESIFDFLRDVLLLRFPKEFNDAEMAEWLDFVMRLQQITGPVMAKGVEDAAFYVYNRLISLNDVGGSPDRFGTSLETFHGQNIERSKFWPHALITTATHDAKRGEDVRARINVLSEIPREWGDRVRGWRRMNRKRKRIVDGREAPDLNEEYLLYQTLIGAWPLEEMDAASADPFVQRIKEYMIKAAREGKDNTSWINPEKAYEEALLSFIEGVVRPSKKNTFLRDFLPFQRTISHYGMYNSLSQTLLKICSPGVPDFFQGTELWDLSLVDPDNRRPVDYVTRTAMLAELRDLAGKMPAAKLARDLTAAKEDGRIKMHLISHALEFRGKNREVFERGEYTAIDAAGVHAGHVCAFERRWGSVSIITAAPRFLTCLISGSGSVPFGEAVWQDTRLVLPEHAGAEFRNVFTGEVVTAAREGAGRALLLAHVFAGYPVALLTPAS